MTLDEAHLILNVKRGDAMESIMRVCCHSFLFFIDYHVSFLVELPTSLQGQLTSSENRKTGNRQTNTNTPFALSAIQGLQGTRTTGSRNEVALPGFIIIQDGRRKRNTTTTRTTTRRSSMIYTIDFIYFIVAYVIDTQFILYSEK